MLRFAIVGLGGLGKVHFRNVIGMEKERGDIRLVALCDVEQERFSDPVTTNLGGVEISVDISKYNLYTDLDEMLHKEELDFVITAVPTYLHERISVKVLERGIHVFSEKPMALNLEQCENMIKVAREKGKILMIGQCLRYWPEYCRLKEMYDSKEFGELIRAEFLRYSPTPTWSWQNWMMDYDKSGCAALDLHVHDVDFINHAFGKPISVYSLATHHVTKFDSIFTHYEYEDMVVTSSCDWGMVDTYPFRPQFVARFEKASVEMSEGALRIYEPGKEPRIEQLNPENAYVSEINDFINCIKVGRESTINNPESVMQSLRIALCEMESALKGEKVYV